MPSEAEVAAPPASPEPKDINLTVPLEAAFARAFGESPEGEEAEEQQEQVEAPAKPQPKRQAQPEPEVEPEPELKPAAKKAAKPPTEPASISDILFKDKEPPVPVPVEAAEPVKEVAPPEMKGKARENFERLSGAKFEAEKRAIAAENKIKELEKRQAEGDPDAKVRIQQLENQIKQYEPIIERANLEMHPRFQAEFVIPRQQLLEQAKVAAQDAGIDPQAVEQALQLRGKAQADKLDELYSDISSPTLRGKIERAVDNIGNIDLRRENTLKNHKVVMERLNHEEQIQRHRSYEQQEQVVKTGLKTAQAFLEEKFNVFSAVDDPKFAWWNDRLQTDVKNAEKIMLEVSDPQQMTVAALMASRFPMLHEAYKQEITARKDLERQLREFKDSEPSLGGKGGGRRSSELTEEEDENMDIAAAMIRGLNNGK